MTNSFFK